jgi:hypothetical protein
MTWRGVCGRLFCSGEEVTATNQQVTQWLTIAPLGEHLHLLVQLITAHQAAEPNHKVMCFFPTVGRCRLTV